MIVETKNTIAFYNTEIPSDWKIIQLGEVISDMKSGLSRELSFEDIGLPVIRSNNLINNTVDYSDIKFWHTVDNQGANTENYFLSDGDILVNFINSISQIGKCAYFKNVLKRPVIFTTNLMVVRFNKTLIDSRFFLYFTLLDHYQKFVDAITKPAINQASFTTKDYKKLLIPLPIKPFQPFLPRKQLLHEPFFTDFFLGDEFFGGLDGGICRTKYLCNGFLLRVWSNLNW